ncbi:MAG: 50S ribosomal protein L29 [Elusimicrobia bacterium CG1_02_63_36]|nr:MAG: 50S ribosomal protein L29 [Elusimicrobia bacterium CG1_02_63_36]PIP85046.1 MAG: 50S ribosomal protein L29 [Elusimicrobia bacterium CG22_combo_CG10-13_8_21_14_all_63_91]PJA12521.1 MAG: 50S ribosomal protein L29 [Elusimicrobia bacterium CG_4_10_14_0_2_um_filter_63_34]PJB25277.1 MAG: 50S ribosomal protein L29 [Elusimicrobia bacterium CG_4_9_14_3_um_filter_62_55]
MKRKEKEIKSTLSADEIRAEIEKLEEKQFRLNFKHKVTPLGNPMELRQVRRDIARLKTWLRSKELQASTKE